MNNFPSLILGMWQSPALLVKQVSPNPKFIGQSFSQFRVPKERFGILVIDERVWCIIGGDDHSCIRDLTAYL